MSDPGGDFYDIGVLGRPQCVEARLTVFTRRINAVEGEHVEVEVKIDAASEPLDERHRPALAIEDTGLIVAAISRAPWCATHTKPTKQ